MVARIWSPRRVGARVDVLVNTNANRLPQHTGAPIIRELRPGAGAYTSIHNPSRTKRLRLGGGSCAPRRARYTLPSWLQLAAEGTSLMRTVGYKPSGEANFVLGIVPYFIPAVPDGVAGRRAVRTPPGRRSTPSGRRPRRRSFREGAGLPPTGLGAYGAFQRRDECRGSVDTGSNSADFIPINPHATDGDARCSACRTGALRRWRRTDNDIPAVVSCTHRRSPRRRRRIRERVGDELIIRRRIRTAAVPLVRVCQKRRSVGGPVAVKKLVVRTTELSTIGNSNGAILTLNGVRNPDDSSAPIYSPDVVHERVPSCSSGCRTWG